MLREDDNINPHADVPPAPDRSFEDNVQTSNYSNLSINIDK
jgi:hypothetical protein